MPNSVAERRVPLAGVILDLYSCKLFQLHALSLFNRIHSRGALLCRRKYAHAIVDCKHVRSPTLYKLLGCPQ